MALTAPVDTDAENTLLNSPAPDDVDAWRAKLLDYYTQNAPTKVKIPHPQLKLNIIFQES